VQVVELTDARGADVNPAARPAAPEPATAPFATSIG
jgi:hypothetical protein